MRILKPRLILALLLMLILSVQSAFGTSVSGSCGNGGWESSTNLDFNAPTNGGVDGGITLADGVTYPTVSGSGDFDPTWTVSDPTGRKATVFADVRGSTTYSWEGYLDYNDNGEDWAMNPAGENIVASSGSSYLEAYQHLVTSGATSVYAYAEASPAGTTPDRYARVSLKIDGNGNANVRQTATALDTLAIAMQRGTAGGNTVVTTTEASQDASNYYSLTRTATGVSTLGLGFYDTAVADTTDSIDGDKAEILTTKLSGTVSIEDHRITNGAEQKVALTNSVKTGTMTSKNTGSIINDMVNSVCTGSDATIKVYSGTSLVTPWTYKEHITIDKSITIQGIKGDGLSPGTLKPVISGDGLSAGSLFSIGLTNSNIAVALDNLQITKGRADRGAGINNYAVGTSSNAVGLAVSNCYIDRNTASAGGAGLRNYGSASVTDTTFDANTMTQAGSQGGAIFTYGNLQLTGCTVKNNIASLGAGLFAAAPSTKTVSVSNCVFDNNGATSTQVGGAIAVYTGSLITIADTTIINNKAVTGAGIGNWGKATLSGVNTITGNVATSYGGGIYNYIGATTNVISGKTTIGGNTAPTNNGGGIYNKGTITGASSYISFGSGNTGGNKAGSGSYS